VHCELQGPTAIYSVQRPKVWLDLDNPIDRNSYRFRLPGHCGIFTVEMNAIHFGCDLIESKPMGAYIIFLDSFGSIEGMKSIGMSNE
jgi:hypothetical protein